MGPFSKQEGKQFWGTVRHRAELTGWAWFWRAFQSNPRNSEFIQKDIGCHGRFLSAEEWQWNWCLEEMNWSVLFKTKDKLERIDPEERPSCESSPEMICHVSRPGIEEWWQQWKWGKKLGDLSNEKAVKIVHWVRARKVNNLSLEMWNLENWGCSGSLDNI